MMLLRENGHSYPPVGLTDSEVLPNKPVCVVPMSLRQPIPKDGPKLTTLYSHFPGAEELPEFVEVPGNKVPEPYHTLLVHPHHMTVTVEKHHGGLVDVRVLERCRQGAWYARKILLALQGTNRVVQFGIMRINLDLCSDAVSAAILREDTPLGRILIQNNVLRRIEPTAYLKISPNGAMMEWFGLSAPLTTYGRLAIIHCDHKPAVELLEVVAPG